MTNDELLIKEWLDECRTESTKASYQKHIKFFQEWYQKPLSSFLELDMKEMRHIALTYQSAMQKKAIKTNSVIAYMTALGSFCNSNGKPLLLKGKRLRIQIDIDSHVFTNGDLAHIFDVADTQGKAVLATLVSLGWEVSSILELRRARIQGLIEQAKQKGERYVYFRDQRKKTGALRLGILNPLAIDWISEWLKVSPESIIRTSKRNLRKNTWDPESLFGYTTKEGINQVLKRLARTAHITTSGRVHTHLIRKWVMSGLSRAGFNEFQIKFCMGKSIPLSDQTYLQTLEEEIRARYPKAYESYLSIKPEKFVTVIDSEKTKELERLTLENKELKAAQEKAKAKDVDLEARMARMESLLKAIQKKAE